MKSSSYILPVVGSLPCGDAYCGQCLKTVARVMLKASLKDLAAIRKVPLDSFLPLPTNEHGRNRLSQLLKSHGQNPEEYFTYRCPNALCYGCWKHRPVRSYLHGAVNEHMAKALEDHNPCTVIAQSGGVDPFAGIFAP